MEETPTVPIRDDDRKQHDDRKPYVTPTLTDFGSCAELTQGAIAVGNDIGIYS
jgi:hypothetical protein